MGKRGPPGFDGLPAERQALFIELLRRRVRSELVEAEFSVNSTTVRNWAAECGMDPPRKSPAVVDAKSAAFDILLAEGLSKRAAARHLLAATATFDTALAAATWRYWRTLPDRERKDLISDWADGVKSEDKAVRLKEIRILKVREEEMDKATVAALQRLVVHHMKATIAVGEEGEEALQRVFDALDHDAVRADWRRAADAWADEQTRLRPDALRVEIDSLVKTMGRKRIAGLASEQ